MRLSRLAAGLVAAITLAATALVSVPGAVAAPPPSGTDLGTHTIVFDPSMPVAQIKAKVDAVAASQVDSEFSTEHYALLFKPGSYGTASQPLTFQVGYNTQVAGLGALPGDVQITGHVDVYNRCLAPDNCIALDNFWRSLSNLTIHVAGLSDCRSSAEFWAASQASPMRRVVIDGGNLSLMDYCTGGPQYASGGYIADSVLPNTINGSQQQYYVRNSTIGGWTNGVWNQVFSGSPGAPAQAFPDPPYTTMAATPVTREQPFLAVDPAGGYRVFVPSVRTDSVGTSWASGTPAGRWLPLSSFAVLHPSDSAQSINVALSQGKNLLLTPGQYDLDKALKVKRADTIVLGLGLPTLTPTAGNHVIDVADVPGVVLAGLMVDGGATNSDVLVQVGSGRTANGKAVGHQKWADPADPTLLSDVFVRIGGDHVGKATVSIEVNTDHTILDHLWVWRADHGDGVGWAVNTARNGVVVNGDDVTATGLFVEHFQQYNVIWNGERGQTIFFQNELPYDPPNQAAYQHGSVLGWAAYKVADSVKTHSVWGAGSYVFFNVDPTIHVSHAFEVPATPGVVLHDLVTVNLNGGTIDHVVNDTGGSTTAPGSSTTLLRYPV